MALSFRKDETGRTRVQANMPVVSPLHVPDATLSQDTGRVPSLILLVVIYKLPQYTTLHQGHVPTS